MTKPAAVQNDPMTPGMSPLQAFLADSFDISKMGERLRFGVDKASLLEESRSGSVDNPILIATEQYLAKVETILTRMHEIASLAADEKLMNLVQDKQVTDLVRIDMQIEMEQLRKELQVAEINYKAKAAGSPTYAEIVQRGKANRINSFEHDFFGMEAIQGDKTTMLERARDRIMKGEAWDVKEAFVFSKLEEEVFTIPNVNSSTVYFKQGSSVEEGHWAVIDDDVLNAQYIPTVREQLERSKAIILMDSKSAAEGVMRLEKDLESLQKLRDKHMEAVVSYHEAKASGKTFNAGDLFTMAVMTFERIAYGSELDIYSQLFIESTTPGYFYFEENEEFGVPARIVGFWNLNSPVSPADAARGMMGGILSINTASTITESEHPKNIYMYTETTKPEPPVRFGNAVQFPPTPSPEPAQASARGADNGRTMIGNHNWVM